MRRYTVTVDGTPFTIDVEETASDRFTVTVGGQTFEASLLGHEDLPGADVTPGMAPAEASPSPPNPASSGPATASAAPGVRAPSPARASAAGPMPATTAGGGSIVAAPMPGVILEVHVTPGAVVRRGDPLVVLEAMKMRNTIRSPRDGVVLEVTTDAGRPVAPGEPLVRLGDAPR